MDKRIEKYMEVGRIYEKPGFEGRKLYFRITSKHVTLISGKNVTRYGRTYYVGVAGLDSLPMDEDEQSLVLASDEFFQDAIRYHEPVESKPYSGIFRDVGAYGQSGMYTPSPLSTALPTSREADTKLTYRKLADAIELLRGDEDEDDTFEDFFEAEYDKSYFSRNERDIVEAVSEFLEERGV